MPATTCPSMQPELPEHELVSSSAGRISSFAKSSFSGCVQFSLRIFGVSGSLKFIGGGGDGVFGSSGHVDASSSGKKVEQLGDVFNDGDNVPPKSGVLFVGISKLLISFSLLLLLFFTLVDTVLKDFLLFFSLIKEITSVDTH